MARAAWWRAAGGTTGRIARAPFISERRCQVIEVTGGVDFSALVDVVGDLLGK